MGEIKSTLDLVMEKTRHMTMSREEREAQKADEIRKKLNGLIQKHADGLIRKNQFLKEFEKLESIEINTNEQLLRKEILDRIELEVESKSLLELLAFACGADTEELQAVLQEYALKRDTARDVRIGELKEELHLEIDVSGSAVLPNLETDADLEEKLDGLKDDFRKRLEAEKARISP